MKFNVKRSDARQRLFANYWHRWFAWHPVKIDHQWVWLEWVQRRLEWWQCADCGGVSATYRFIPNTKAVGNGPAAGTGTHKPMVGGDS